MTRDELADLGVEKRHHEPDLAESATIYPLISERGDERVLIEWLADHDSYDAVESDATLSEADFDLCIIDEVALRQYNEELKRVKTDAEPVLLPVLLLLSETRGDVINTDQGEIAENVFPSTIDEIVSTPIRQLELEWRIQALLRLRAQSLTTHRQTERLRLFRQAIESSGHAVYITDRDGTIRYVNAAFEDVTGYTRDDAVGENPRLLNSGKMPDGYFEELWRTIRSGDVWHEEVINQRKNGELYTADQTIAPVVDDDHVRAFVAIQNDITEQKEQERSLQTLIENLPGVVYRRRNEPGWPMDIVRGHSQELVGYTAEEIERGDVSWGEDIIHPEDWERVWGEIQEAVGSDRSFEVTYRIQTAESEERWVWEQGRPVNLLNEESEYLEGFITDVTERKHLREDLRASKQRYESLFTSIRDAILVADTDRRIIDCNPAFTDLFGYELAEIEGKPTKYVYESEAEFETMGDAIGEHMDDPTFTHTVHYETKSGQVFPGETNVFYLRNPDDEIIGFIALIRNISDQVERTRQLQIIDRVLRHNLRNDMNIIKGYAETIQSQAEGPIAEFAGNITTESEHLLTIADKEREITELLSKEHPPDTIDLGAIIDATVEKARERHPAAEFTVDSAGDVMVTAIEAFPKALNELLENAAIHSDQGTPSIGVNVTAGGDTVEIRVTDDGPGIPKMEREILTGAADIDPLYHGSGLGLWLVHLIVQRSGGTLAFEENDPRGSVVIIRIPTVTTGGVGQ